MTGHITKKPTAGNRPDTEQPDVAFGSNDIGYGIDDGETPGIGIGVLSVAISAWCYLNDKSATVPEVAKAFRISEHSVRLVIHHDEWAYLDGDNIEFDGE